MIVWRYLSWEFAVEAFETGEWKVGRISELNDPLDCRPTIVGSRGKAVVGEPGIIKALTDTVGLLCYSEKIDDPAVWAHYGRSHSGVAFGFHFPEGEEKPVKMKYVKRRPRISLDDLERAKGNDIIAAVLRGWNSKAPGWRFEAEHRHFISLAPNAVTYRRPHFFRRLPWERLNYVVLGVRCPLATADLMHLTNNIPGFDGFAPFFACNRAEVDPVLNRIDPRLPTRDGQLVVLKRPSEGKLGSPPTT
jgi:hypothetical protein